MSTCTAPTDPDKPIQHAHIQRPRSCLQQSSRATIETRGNWQRALDDRSGQTAHAAARNRRRSRVVVATRSIQPARDELRGVQHESKTTAQRAHASEESRTTLGRPALDSFAGRNRCVLSGYAGRSRTCRACRNAPRLRDGTFAVLRGERCA